MKKEKLRKTVFNSAWKIVENEGIDRLNVRKIAKLSDCSLGSIYNAFENFESLQLHINSAVLSDLFSNLRAVIKTGIERRESLREIFRALGSAYIEFGNKNKFLWKAVFEHFPVEQVPEWYQKQTQDGIYQICEDLAKHFNISVEEMKCKVGFFWASIHGMGAILLNRKMEMVSDLFRDSSLNTYVEYCLEGLFPAGK